MRIQVTTQMKTPGNTGAFQGEYLWQETEFNGQTVAFASPLTVHGTCVYDGEGFTVRGEASTLLKSVCAKCAKPFDEPFGFAFEERFEKSGSEDDGIYAYEGEELDLSTMLRDNVFLHLPISSVCSEDCKGLCPLCGCDRNTAQCDCALQREDDSDNPFAALGALLNENKEV